MKRILSLFTVLLFTMGITAQSLLPLPQHVEWQRGTFHTRRPIVVQSYTKELSPSLVWDFCGTPTTDEQRTRHRLVLTTLPGAPSSEAYNLRVSRDSICIAAASSAGFYYAHATLQQLLDRKGRIPCCTIHDYPAYEWRGIMLDVSRHFFPLSFLERQIDILASYKINRLHLHLTDAAGWRMEIKRYPLLTSKAAWRTHDRWKEWWNSPRHYVPQDSIGAHGGYYTQDELRQLVAYAQERGILIIPEIEMPAHSEEVLAVYPELSCTHVPYRQADFCPGNEATYEFLQNVLQEVMDVFPSPYIHIGGDEAGGTSWATCALCQQRMHREGLTDKHGLQTYLIRRIGEFLEAHGRHLIGWDEIIDPSLPDGSTVMVWRHHDQALKAIRQGFPVVLSPGSHCYLDAYQDAPHTQPEAIGGLTTLQKIYNYIPDEGMTYEERTHIQGIQANLWTEYVPTPEHAEYMLYPRALALAEIAWNGTATKDYPDFHQRALQHTERLREAGVHPFDLRNEVGDRKASLQSVKHNALHCNVAYHHDYSPYYPANGAATLTDGLRGGWNHGDARWQGFIGGDTCINITIDLGQVQRIHIVTADFMQSTRQDIFLPVQCNYAISTDGCHFTPLTTFETPEDVNAEVSPEKPYTLPYCIEPFTWKGRAKGRYLRIKALRGKRRGWLFTDEIVVK